jgi:hypothetical protein
MRGMHRYLAIAIATGSLIGAAGDVRAQAQLSPPTLDKGVWIDATHTSFKDFDVNLPSTVWTIAGRIPVGSRLGVNVDVPFSYASLDVGGSSQASSVFGNPYVGVDFAPRRDLSLELGTRLPINTLDEQSLADAIAVIADPFRLEAFIEDHIPIQVAASFSRPIYNGFGIRARAGAVTLVYTGDDEEEDEAPTALDYGVAGTYAAGPAQLGIGLIGRWDVSADDGDFGSNSFHQASLTADIGLGPVRPGVAIRMPLDSEFRDLVSSSLGLYLRVPIQ